MKILLDNNDFIIRYDDRSAEIVISAFHGLHFQSECSISAKPVVHAHWVYFEYPTVWYGEGRAPKWKCSHCGSEQQYTTDFCPDCGAIMDEEIVWK